MENNLTAIAKDNTIRVSSYKLANIARSIVNLKVNKAVNQLKFSQKRISNNVLKVLVPGVRKARWFDTLALAVLFALIVPH